MFRSNFFRAQLRYTRTFLMYVILGFVFLCVGGNSSELSSSNTIQTLPKYTVNDVAALQPEYHLPQTLQSVSFTQTEDTINLVDVEDAVKYMPSIFIRKRNYGDT